MPTGCRSWGLTGCRLLVPTGHRQWDRTGLLPNVGLLLPAHIFILFRFKKNLLHWYWFRPDSSSLAIWASLGPALSNFTKEGLVEEGGGPEAWHTHLVE